MLSKSFTTTTHPRLSEPIGTWMMPLQTLDAAHGAERFDIYTGGLCSCFGLIFSCCFLSPYFWNVNAFSMTLYNGIMSLGFHFTEAPMKTALSLISLNSDRIVKPSITKHKGTHLLPQHREGKGRKTGNSRPFSAM